MTDTGRDEMELRDEDRLPWLEPAEDVEEEEGISPAKLVAFVIAGLVAIGIVIGGIYWWQGRQAALMGGEGELIAAQEGDYKVKPDQPGGMTVDGKGDTQFATSAGEAPKGAIDLDALPEAPVERGAAAPAAQPKAPPAQAKAEAVAPVPESGGRLAAKAPTAQPGAPARAPAGGVLVQLGAFSSEAAANKAWDRLSKRFAFLAPLTKAVESTKVAGATLYRLRAAAGSSEQARDVCGKLKVGGESCIVVG